MKNLGFGSVAADEDDSASRDKLLDSLRLGSRVILTITFHQVDAASDRETGSERNDQRLQNTDRTLKNAIIPSSF